MIRDGVRERRRCWAIGVAVLAALLLTACGGAPSGGPDNPSTDSSPDDPIDTPAETPADDPSSMVVSVSLDAAEVRLVVGANATLRAVVEASDDVDRAVEWESEDPSVATVDGGVVEAIAPGGTTVWAISVHDATKRASAAVVVEPAPAVVSVAVRPDALTLGVGERMTLIATVTATDGVDASVVWSSNAEGVATVSEDGAVDGHAIGSAIVTATTVADPSVAATAVVTVVAVSDPAPSSVRFVSSTASTAIVGTAVFEAPRVEVVDGDGRPVVGGTVRFDVIAGGGSIEPATPVLTDGAGVAALTRWSLGTIAGAQRLRAYVDCADPSVTADLVVDALPGSPSAAGSSFEADPTTLIADGSSTSMLSVTLQDAYGNRVDPHDVLVTFDVPSVGTVGIVSATPEGIVTATFTAPDVATVVELIARIDGVALERMVSIDVTEIAAVSSVSIEGGDRTLSVGSSEELHAVVNTSGGATDAVHWSTEGEAVVTVSEAGVVTAVGVGTADVIARSVFDANVEGRITVTVVGEQPPEPVPWTYGIVTTGSFAVTGSSFFHANVWAGANVDIGGASDAGEGVHVWAGGSCRAGMVTCLANMEPPMPDPVDWHVLRAAVVDHYLGDDASDACDVQYGGSVTLVATPDSVICLAPGASLVLVGEMSGVLVLGDDSTSVVTHGDAVPSATQSGLGIAVVAGAVELGGRDSTLAGMTTVVAAGDVTVEATLGTTSGPVESVIVTLGDVSITQLPIRSRAIIRADGRVALNGGAGVGTFAGTILAGDGGITVNGGVVFERPPFEHFLSDW